MCHTWLELDLIWQVKSGDFNTYKMSMISNKGNQTQDRGVAVTSWAKLL
jgi:hypothetical protein